MESVDVDDLESALDLAWFIGLLSSQERPKKDLDDEFKDTDSCWKRAELAQRLLVVFWSFDGVVMHWVNAVQTEEQSSALCGLQSLRNDRERVTEERSITFFLAHEQNQPEVLLNHEVDKFKNQFLKIVAQLAEDALCRWYEQPNTLK